MKDIITHLSPLSRRTKGSASYAMAARAAQLRAQGHDIISLNVGEPDFDTPSHIKQAVCKALETRREATRYTPAQGLLFVREAVCRKLKRDNQLDFALDQIIITSGAKQALYNCIGTIIAEGDEVILPTPYWCSYPDMIEMAGGRIVTVTALATENFKITAQQLETHITKYTKMLILNSPNNPSGAVYTAEEMKELMAVVRRHPHIFVLSDEIYEHILLGPDQHVSPLQVAPDLADRIIIVNGVSKSYAMTGWRIGFAAGPAPIIRVMTDIQSQQSGCPAAPSQMAAQEAWDGPQNFVQHMRQEFQKRHDLLLHGLRAVPGIQCQAAQGSFYLFADCTESIHWLYQKKKIKNPTDTDLCDYLLDFGVALMPGQTSGVAGHVRISFTTSEKFIAEAVKRIHSAVTQASDPHP